MTISPNELDPPPPQRTSRQEFHDKIILELSKRSPPLAEQELAAAKLAFPSENWTDEEIGIALQKKDRGTALRLSAQAGPELRHWISNLVFEQKNTSLIENAITTTKQRGCTEGMPLLTAALEREPHHWTTAHWLWACAIETNDSSLCKKLSDSLAIGYQTTPYWIQLNRICTTLETGFRPMNIHFDALHASLPSELADIVIVHYLRKQSLWSLTASQLALRIEQVIVLLKNETESLATLIVQIARTETNASLERPCAILRGRWDRRLILSAADEKSPNQLLLKGVSSKNEAQQLCKKPN